MDEDEPTMAKAEAAAAVQTGVPDAAARFFALGSKHHRRGDLKAALHAYANAVRHDRRHANAYNNMGVALRSMGKLEAAVACYDRALALNRAGAGTHSNLGNALRGLGRYALAAIHLGEAVKLAPRSAETFYNLGLVLRDLGQLDDALRCFEKSLATRRDHPDCVWDQALTFLMMGDFERGFPAYEARWNLARARKRPIRHPLWDGSDLDGRTIVLHNEQGFGDMIQFVRFVPLVAERGGTVVLEVQPELSHLFEGVRGASRVVLDGAVEDEADVAAPLMSVPGILGTTLETIPAEVPYLAAPDVAGDRIRVHFGAGCNVGICWAGKITHADDRNRSCSLAHFVDLMGLADVAFHSLQVDAGRRAIEAQGCEALVTDLGGRLHDFADTAAVISQLDLVITVDTAVAHLAGAMGRPVWVLIPFAADWRWMRDREDNPWYPTMRVFRQLRPGDWAELMARVKEALSEFAAAREKTLRSD
ncbi:MAG: tetratricopeptide repeat-containing glycosyltransferase family protein [Rhodospirillales bacterium]|nr:tetratricopeptide repeat-containing glycosyltransferase family protein [Rhodospirillales bacterium]